LAQRVGRTTDRLVHELGRTPTVAEIARALEITPEQVLDARETATAYRAESLDHPVGDDQDATPSLTRWAPTSRATFRPSSPPPCKP